jgi:uncharacterized membrane protein YtjA (UPF0391 family)
MGTSCVADGSSALLAGLAGAVSAAPWLAIDSTRACSAPRKVTSSKAGAVGTGTAIRFPERSGRMLYWAAIFFVIALVAAVFGFGAIAASAAGVAKVLFVVFLVLAGVSLLFGRRVVT